MTYIWITLIAFLGSLVQGSTGFGYAMVCMSLWPFFVPFKMASIMEVITAFAMTIGISIKFREHINYKLMFPPFIAAAAGSTIGVRLLMLNDDETLGRVLGLALILLAIYFIFYSDKIKIKATTRNGLIFGFISGVCGGMFNIGGPPLVIYFLNATKNKEEYNGTMQFTFVLNILYTFTMHLYYGNVTRDALRYSGISLIGLAAGTYIGLKIFDKLDQEKLNKIVYGFIIIMGVVLFLPSL